LLPPEAVRPGAVAVISQSGACNNIVFNRAQEHGVGVGLAVATGLQASVSVWDVADYALRDERILALSILVENLGRPEEWRPVLETARRTGRSVVLCRLGTSTRGAEALVTHSGSLAGSWPAQEQALRDAGAILVDDLDQMWEVAALCAAWGPPTRPVRLGAIAMSGGEGALISDLAERGGLDMPDVTADFEAVVATHLTLTRGANPFDPTGEVLGRPHVLEPVLDAFIGQPTVDRVLVAWHVLDENVLVDAWPALEALFERYRDRLVLSGWPITALPRWKVLRRAGGPPFLAGSHRAVAAIARYSEGAPYPGGDAPVQPALRPSTPAHLGESYREVREAFASMGVEFGRQVRVATPEQAVAAADVLGWPLVLKADVASTVHKSAAGLVQAGLRDTAAVRAAWDLLRRACDERTCSFLVEEHVLGEIQLFLGVRVDPDVGPVLLLGSGGSAVEFLRDVVLAPARLSAIDELVHRSAVGRFLHERAPASLLHVYAMCAALVALAEDGRVESAELNPVIIELRTGRARAVDARINRAVTPLDGVSDARR
jgi:acyl-CoA synthetase (NDP forming)